MELADSLLRDAALKKELATRNERSLVEWERKYYDYESFADAHPATMRQLFDRDFSFKRLRARVWLRRDKTHETLPRRAVKVIRMDWYRKGAS
jgi:hypothetical protein